MKRTEIARIFADMEHFDGQDVTVCGWTRTIRDMKTLVSSNSMTAPASRTSRWSLRTPTLENYKEIAKQNVGAALICRAARWSSPRRPSSPWR
ncbi:MAG: hypothetical protein ACLT9P_03230 [Evtepia gabavorous]